MKARVSWGITVLICGALLVPQAVLAASATFTSTDRQPAVLGRNTGTIQGGSGVSGHTTTTTSAVTYGVSGRADATTGRGVHGLAWNPNGVNYGVFGQSNSKSGRGVFGLAASTAGSTYAIYGQSNSSQGTGVYGYAPAESGSTFGVLGFSKSPVGVGVRGEVSASNSAGLGPIGVSGAAENSPNGVGVFGTGILYGVAGESSSEGFGLYSFDDVGIEGLLVDVTGRLSGTCLLPSGAIGVTCNFQAPLRLGSTPIVMVTPRSNLSGASYWISGEDTDSFDISLSATAAQDLSFVYLVVARAE